jgi:hypothetical protein
MMNVFSLTVIHPGSSTGGVLNITKIGKPEECKMQLIHLYRINYRRLQIRNSIYATCSTVVKCTIAADTVYINKKGVRGNWMTNHQTFPKEGNNCMKFNQLYQQQKDVVNSGLVAKNMQGFEIPLGLVVI